MFKCVSSLMFLTYTTLHNTNGLKMVNGRLTFTVNKVIDSFFLFANQKDLKNLFFFCNYFRIVNAGTYTV